MLMFPKRVKIRDRKHLDFVKTLPCCVTLIEGETEPAHIRLGTDGGTGLKPSDNCVVPLHFSEHRRQHEGERTYWGDRLEAAKELANAIFYHTGRHDECLKLIHRFQKK
jgi:hypothetical protein